MFNSDGNNPLHYNLQLSISLLASASVTPHMSSDVVHSHRRTVAGSFSSTSWVMPMDIGPYGRGRQLIQNSPDTSAVDGSRHRYSEVKMASAGDSRIYLSSGRMIGKVNMLEYFNNGVLTTPGWHAASQALSENVRISRALLDTYSLSQCAGSQLECAARGIL